ENFQRPPHNNPYSNTYNPGWRNHPNFSWSNQANYQPPPQKPRLEDLMLEFISTSEARFQNQDASIRNIETQVGQLAKIMSERAQGTLPSNIEPNPKEHVNAIFVRSVEETLIEPMKNKTRDLRVQEIPSKQKDEEALE